MAYILVGFGGYVLGVTVMYLVARNIMRKFDQYRDQFDQHWDQ